MLLRDVMTATVECVRLDDTIETAARVMRDCDIGPVPVCVGDRVVGVLTDRDIAVRAVADGLDPRSCRVRDVMTPDAVYSFPDCRIEVAEQLMRKHQLRRLLVLDRGRKLVGIVSLGDLVLRTADPRRTGEVLYAVCGPEGSLAFSGPVG